MLELKIKGNEVSVSAAGVNERLLTDVIAVMMTPFRGIRTLAINDAFTLTAVTLDSNGVSVMASNEQGAAVKLSLSYTIAHDNYYGMCKEVTADTIEQVIDNIRQAMSEILDNIKDIMLKRFDIGYLRGSINFRSIEHYIDTDMEEDDD